MQSLSLSAAMALCAAMVFCATAAPAQIYAPRVFGYPPPPVMTAPPRDAGACRGEDQDFARDAEYLIAQGIAAARGAFAAGAPPLAPDPDLTAIAQGRSCEMALGRQAFSHDDAEGNFIAASRVRDHFGPYGAIGENIMEMGGSRSFDAPTFNAQEFARIAVDGWMKSPGHRANILDPSYEKSGIGVALVDGQAYATQVFFGPPRHRARNP